MSRLNPQTCQPYAYFLAFITLFAFVATNTKLLRALVAHPAATPAIPIVAAHHIPPVVVFIKKLHPYLPAYINLTGDVAPDTREGSEVEPRLTADTNMMRFSDSTVAVTYAIRRLVGNYSHATAESGRSPAR